MSIQVTYGTLRDQQFNKSYKKLKGLSTGLQMGAKLIIAQQLKALAAAGEEASKRYGELLSEYVVKDETGNVTRNDDGEVQLKDGKTEADLQAAVEAHDETVVTIAAPKLHVKAIKNAELSAEDLLALESFIDL